MPEQIIIVDEQDEVITHKERTTKKQEDIYRASALMVVSSKKQILLAQRSFNKSHSPGRWSASAAGTVEKGETYLENIIKEAEEELGIDLNRYDFKKIDKIRVGAKGVSNPYHNFFCQWYLLKIDMSIKNFTIPENEVHAIKWVDKNYLEQDLQSHPKKYTNGMLQIFKVLKKYI